ncbi:MAG: hypothetical protein Q7R70_06155 [Candidatus Diapherotrites archaeon]|nr:hypothetical protein [Candidatus Diapherotrites archaeon]
MPKPPRKPFIPPISGVSRASEHFEKHPRGPTYGKEKLRPVAKPRRTASVELSGLLGKFREMLSEQTTHLSMKAQAELRAIEERNITGSWTAADIERVKQLFQKRELSKLGPLEKRPSAQRPQTARREPVVREHLDPAVSRQAMRMNSLRILQELRQASQSLEISSVHQDQLQQIAQRIQQGTVRIADFEALQKIRKSYISKR